MKKLFPRRLLLILALCMPPAWAQVTTRPLPANDLGTADAQGGESVSYSWSLGRYEIDENRFVAVDNVVLSWKGVRVRCNAAVIWPRDKPGAPEGQEPAEAAKGELPMDEALGSLGVRAIYAEGDVVVTMVERGLVFRCDRVHLDLISQRGIYLDTKLRKELPARDGTVSLAIRAEEMRQLDPNRFEMLGITASTNPALNPGYRIQSPGIRIQAEPITTPMGRPESPQRNFRYEIDESVFFLGDLPLLTTPPYSGNTAENFGQGWIRSASIDSSRQFGPAARVTLGTAIDLDGRNWGDLRIPVQYLLDRGPGLGVDLRYSRDGEYAGFLQTFYQRDKGQDELFGTPPDKDRGRVTWRHRHFLPEHIQLDLEFSKISDRGYLPEYREGEFKSEKPQETLAYLKRAHETTAFTLVAKGRVNDFFTQLEERPRFGYNLFSYPILDFDEDHSLYFDADYEVGNLRRVYDDELGLRDVEATRVDLDNVVSAPFFLGFLKLEPFAGLRYTYYDRGRVVSDDRHRVGFTWGARATAEFSRTFDVTGGLFDLDGLRHIILPEIEYRRVQYVSRDQADFVQLDAVDAFSEREEIVFALRNRLQTFWETNGQRQVVNFVDLDLEWRLFPQADRDNFGETFGNLDVDFLWRLSPRLLYVLDFEYSFRLDTMEIFNTTIGWEANQNLFLGLGYRRYVDVNDVVLGIARWRVDERLGLIATSGYDFQEGASQDHRIAVQRIGEDWVFEVELDYDNRGGIGFGISFTPRALFDPRVRFGSIRNEPRFGTFGNGTLR
jgi:LPS transport system D